MTMIKPESVLARRRALVAKISTEGAEAAYAAALAVCNDPRAPAPAKATCATTILRAGGYLTAKAGEDVAAKDPSEMTSAELHARLAELRADRERLDGADDDPSDVFG